MSDGLDAAGAVIESLYAQGDAALARIAELEAALAYEKNVAYTAVHNYERREELIRANQLLYEEASRALAVEKANAAALRNVLEDCHSHDLYVKEGADSCDAYRKQHGSDFGRVSDECAADHWRSVKAAIEGKMGGDMLVELRGLRAEFADLRTRLAAAQKERDELAIAVDRRIFATLARPIPKTMAERIESFDSGMHALVQSHARRKTNRDEARARAEAAEAEAKRLRDALEWYADAGNYAQHIPIVWTDHGKRARAAMAPSRDQEER